MRPVIVTTKHRGIFCGLLVPSDHSETDTVTLEQCRMAISFKGTGVIGLANGPTGRVSGMSPSAEIKDVTAIFDVSEDGWNAWSEVDPKSGKN